MTTDLGDLGFRRTFRIEPDPDSPGSRLQPISMLGRERTVLALLSALAAVPFVVSGVRTVVSGPRGLITGDAALMDFQTRQALHWNLLLGVYDRFGWHHPGPAYEYFVSFIERIVGASHPGQAQLLSAVLVNCAAISVTVYLVGIRFGRRAACLSATAALLTATALGPTALNDPSVAHVVVLPLVLLCVLVSDAAGGSTISAAASILVASLIVETYVSTIVLVAGLELLGLAAFVLSLYRGRNRLHGIPVAVGLLTVAAISWFPVFYEQLTDHPGNLTLMDRFFASDHGHLGLQQGAAIVGTASAAVVGTQPPQFRLNSGPGIHALLIVLLGEAVVLGIALWCRSPAARLAVVAVVGTCISVMAGALIVGMPWEYLISWSAAPVIASVIAGAVLLSRLRLRLLFSAGLAVAVIVGSVANLERRQPSISSVDVKTIVSELTAADPNKKPIGLAAYDVASLSIVAGVCDALAAARIPFAVPRDLRFEYPPTSADPAFWAVIITDPQALPPVGYNQVLRTPTLGLSFGRTPPYGWYSA